MKMRDFVWPETLGAGRRLVRMQFARAGTASNGLLLPSRLPFSLCWLACNSNAPKTPEAKPEPKGPELLTARAAFQKLFIAARNYAADVKPFRIESTPTTDGNGHDGKSAIWTPASHLRYTTG